MKKINVSLKNTYKFLAPLLGVFFVTCGQGTTKLAVDNIQGTNIIDLEIKDVKTGSIVVNFTSVPSGTLTDYQSFRSGEYWVSTTPSAVDHDVITTTTRQHKFEEGQYVYNGKLDQFVKEK